MKIGKHARNRFVKSENDCEQGPDFYASLFINSPIGIYIVQDGKFRFLNPEFLRISGYEEHELLGTDSLGIVHPEERDFVREKSIQMLKKKSMGTYDHRVITKNGEIRWIIETVTSITYGGRRAALGYFMDNTQNVLTKEALLISEDKFKKVFRSSPDWFVISTLEDGFYVDVNEAFLRTTGYERHEVIGKSSVELGIWAQREKRSQMLETLKKEGAVRNMEVDFRMKSGEIRNVLWSAEVIDYGEEKCLIAVTRDVTARHRAQMEQLKREKLQGILEIAGATCHEVNQPLQYMCLLLDEVLKDDPENENLKEIKKQCDRITSITQKIEGITLCESMDYIQGKKIIDIIEASKEKVKKDSEIIRPAV
ncbi:MAG: PAS domain-containing protein [Deltaproteobacteria bacterium]|nr:PAS domain-containing protein [Deltaproteobacteria bacterium]